MPNTFLRTVVLTCLLGALGACSTTAPPPAANTVAPWHAGTKHVAD